jgi:uncharacterized membrane protein YhaH (DUF805 family)
MSLTELLFSFKGRINRKPWWIAAIAVGLASGALTGILEFAAKSSGSVVIDPDTNQIEPTGLFGAAVFVVGLANTWINFALGVKRLHDRDRSGWWLVAQFAILVLAVVAVVGSIVAYQAQISNGLILIYLIAAVLGIAALVISIWLFVEIGFLRGTQGPNRFGPDPLGAVKSDATL